MEEARDAIGDEREFAVAARYFDIYERGEMPTDPRRNVLWVSRGPQALAQEFDLSVEEARALLARAKAKMKAARDTRPRPFVDASLYTSWNAMMAGAFLDAARYLRRRDCRDTALRALDRIWAEAYDEERGIVHRLGDPESPRLVEDHVQAAAGWLDAFETTQEPEMLARAERCMGLAVRLFWDEGGAGGGFFDVPEEHDRAGYLAERFKPIQDAPSPAPNGVAALVLARLWHLTGKEDYRRRAEATLRAFAQSAREHHLYAATYFRALDAFLNPPAHAVVTGDRGEPRASALLEAALSVYRPRLLVQQAAADGGSPVPEVLAPKLSAGRAPRGYFCAGTACAAPADEAVAYRDTVSRFGLPERTA